jgi:glycosyltransferase involved in cell wall biosynthesis
MPGCLVTNRVPHYRVEPFRMLAEAEGIEVIAFRETEQPDGLVVHRTTEAGAARLAASGRYRVVICGIGDGRVSLLGSYLGARARRVPFVLWATLWGHPRTPLHLLGYPLAAHLYRAADAVVTYGPHVSSYVRRRRRRGNIFEAPQAVSPAFRSPVAAERRASKRRELAGPGVEFLALFVGRLEDEKGVRDLVAAWKRAALGDAAALVLAGAGPLRPEAEGAADGVRLLGPVAQRELPSLYAAADVVVLPSIKTRTFLEPWGLVVNEAMHQGTPVIVSDAVGAAAGGLVRTGRNGLVFPERDVAGLAEALRTLAHEPDTRAALSEAAREDAEPYTFERWVEGMQRALAAVGASRV